MAAKVKKGDTVVVTTGRDKGKQGSVLQVLPAEERVVVQGVNVVTRHRKPSGVREGGLDRFEAPIHISNVMHIDPKDGKATRVGFKIEDGKKVRVARRSGELLDK
ncbi:50S ribosomal protein L24 [Radicibacter daui]|jgi:large subunit ribosomal protein L24|uniref:50S ribosomal protein L24 n=1 Tax=Radicibacter daui TaxID=3064829 RepID=UPI0040469674